jgi:uncharacterized protein YbaR (Trm112 family)
MNEHSEIDEALLAILVCPQSREPLRHDAAAGELICSGADCGLAFPIRDGIPVLLIDEARRTRSGA